MMMPRYWTYLVLLSAGTIIFLVLSVVILALIPIYTADHSGNGSLDSRIQPFQIQFQFDSNYMIVRREIKTSPAVHMTSFSTIENTLRQVLDQQNITRVIIPKVNEAYIDWANDLLRVGGYYLFSSWCNLQCQQSHMRSLNNIYGSLNSISPLVLRIGSQRYRLILRHIDVLNGIKDLATLLSLNIFISNSTTKSLSPRALSKPVHGKNVVTMLNQVLQSHSFLQHVSFDINSASINSPEDANELNVDHLLKYPLSCFQLCQEETLDTYLAILMKVENKTRIIFNDGEKTYIVQRISPAVTSNSVSVPFRTFSYDLGSSNTSTVEEGSITDENTLKNITDSLQRGALNGTKFEIIHASLESNAANKGRMIPKASKHLKLILTIQFIFEYETCRHKCQDDFLWNITNVVVYKAPSMTIHIHGTELNINSPTINVFIRPPGVVVTAITPSTTTTSAISTPVFG